MAAIGSEFRPHYGLAAVFSFDSARIFTRTLAGLAAASSIWPVEGLRMRVPALRAGTLRRLTFRRPGNTNSPAPRGWTEPRSRSSKVALDAGCRLSRNL